MNYWLMKSEPQDYSIDDLKRDKIARWDGVRNYQVRNMMRDDMKVGDLALFYHSNAGEATGIVGVMKIVSESYPDPTQFDKKDKHYDPRATKNNPPWLCVDVGYQKKLPRVVTLTEIKATKKLSEMRLVQKGNRLSVMPVAKSEFEYLIKIASED